MKKLLFLLSFVVLFGACSKDEVKNVKAKEVSIDPQKLELIVSETKQLVANVLPKETADKSVTWICDKTDIIKVDEEGNVTGLQVGEALVKVTTTNGLKAICEVSVKAQTITLTPDQAQVMVGKSLQLTPKVIPNNLDNISYVWTSSSKDVATVSNSGLVQGVKEGTAKITVEASNGLSAICNIVVTKYTSPEDLEKEKELTKILTDATSGWLSSSPIYSGSLNNRLLEMKFMDNKLATVASESVKAKDASYFFTAKGDDITLTLETYAGFIEPGIVLDPKDPMGPKLAMNFKVKSYSADKVVLFFSLSGSFTRELTLTKQTKAADFSKQTAIRAKMGESRNAILKDFLSTNIGCQPNLTLCITKGIEGATVENPVKAGFFYSSMTSTVDIAYNWNGVFSKYCGMLVFTETGFVSGIALQYGDTYISNFKYNTSLNRFEIDEPGVEGHFECFNLPQYEVKGVCDEFLNDYSLWMRNFFPESLLDMKKKVTNASFNSTTNLKVIDTYLVTKYNRREPIIADDGSWAIDEKSKKYDYTETDLLGEGMLFCFEYYYQFFYYFVPFKAEKIGEDRVRFSRNGETQCVTKVPEHAAIMKSAYDNNATINAFIDKICEKEGLLIKKSEIEGSFDFDFRFIKNPDQWFIARNQ